MQHVKRQKIVSEKKNYDKNLQCSQHHYLSSLSSCYTHNSNKLGLERFQLALIKHFLDSEPRVG